jgi:hypothetical protein
MTVNVLYGACREWICERPPARPVVIIRLAEFAEHRQTRLSHLNGVKLPLYFRPLGELHRGSKSKDQDQRNSDDDENCPLSRFHLPGRSVPPAKSVCGKFKVEVSYNPCQLNRSMQHLSNQLIHKMLTPKNRFV